jgi:hypothetical protein
MGQIDRGELVLLLRPHKFSVQGWLKQTERAGSVAVPLPKATETKWRWMAQLLLQIEMMTLI